ncbi:2-keto-4-pentenoate hydratase [Gimibacter soli]|uniref:Fumarylacetoacetate hydrolase family protein n=1 Tax=Gimibacter soli TaxID=3024400 RepID=A0AAF0BJP5_9PROT|nr:fumarylacetoacetate hydrolase family protein [Gimibacter soli]WCL53339.1 fumarylacetoacetate hydrolase family protein [Gimibacter soli]
MTNDILAEIAADLMEAEGKRQPVAPVRDRITSGSLDDAYRIQFINTERGLAAGRRLVGRKIGLTSAAVQKQLGVGQPDFGALFADMAFGDSEPVPTSRLIQPKIEAEIAFVLARDLTAERLTLADIISATAYALPALEIVDSRIADWKIGILDTIADNASSGLFVLGGHPKRLGDFDPVLCGMVMERGGDQVSLGAGAACLGNPLNAVKWLAEKMVEVGTPLQAGDVVLSGALGPMVAATAGDVFEVRINGLGSVRAIFE